MGEVRSCTFPAGTYYIGDPSYVLEDHQSDYGDEGVVEVAPDNSQMIVAASATALCAGGDSFAFYYTALGEGCFCGTDDREYCVDSGCIGIVPASLVKEGARARVEQHGLGTFHQFHGDVTFSVDELGTFCITCGADKFDLAIFTR